MAVAATAGAAGLGAPAAVAGTVSVQTVEHTVRDSYGTYTVSYDTLVYVAAPGEANDAALEIGPGVTTTATLRDEAGVSAGSGCIAADQFTATCSIRPPGYAGLSGEAEGQRDVLVDLGDGDDRLHLLLRPNTTTIVNGGEGNDRLEGGTSSSDFLIGGSGVDYLDGAGTNPRYPGDRLQGGPGADTLLGSEGTEVDYSDHAVPVHVDFEGDRDDGAAGENDLVGEFVTDARGGSGDDELVGNDGANGLLGGGGSDHLIGAGGHDVLSAAAGLLEGGGGEDSLYPGVGRALGGDGDDRLSGAAGSSLDGGPGSDELAGTTGAETLIGGPGRDMINGAGGDDEIQVRDGEYDYVRCDPWPRRPAGHATEDVLDFSFGCARVDRDGPALARIFPRGFPIPATRPYHAHVQVGCPDDHRPACAGVVRFVLRGRVIGRGPFRILPGRIDDAGARFTKRRYIERVLARDHVATVTVLLRTPDSAGRSRLLRSSLEFRA